MPPDHGSPCKWRNRAKSKYTGVETSLQDLRQIRNIVGGETGYQSIFPMGGTREVQKTLGHATAVTFRKNGLQNQPPGISAI